MAESCSPGLRIQDPRPYIVYGHQRIHFARHKRRNERPSVMIKVQPDGRVEAHAPVSASDRKVREAVKARASWIARQLRDFERSRGSGIGASYRSGESHYYLGRQYLLKVYDAGGQPESVKLVQGRFEVAAEGASAARVEALLAGWYMDHARDYFDQRVRVLSEGMPWVASQPPVTIKAMTRRWGSCSPSRRLTLNLHLIRAPRLCIDYVIIHELCHLVERSHGKRFMEILNSAMPGWQEPKKRLDERASTWLGGL